MQGSTQTNNRGNVTPGGRTSAQSSNVGAAPNPSRYRRQIPDLRAGESVVLLQRQHPFVLVRKLAVPGLLLVLWLVASVFALPLIGRLQPDPLGPPAEGIAAWLPSSLYLGWLGLAAVLVLWAAYRVLDWTDDWVALTNRRLIIMDKTPFLRESRREAPISRVQNVTAEYPHGMGVALDFGDLKVDTAGIGVLMFGNLPHPKTMREAIFAQQTAMNAAQPSPEAQRKAIARSIILGTDPAVHEQVTPPGGMPAVPSRGTPVPQPQTSGYNMLNVILPLRPQRDGDMVTWHMHWIFLVRGLAWPFIVIVLVMAGWFASISQGQSGQFGSVPVILGWLAVVLVPLCLLWALWNWADWRNDLYRLDRERIYDIERLPFGLREQSTQPMVTRVTDGPYVVPGPMANLLNYGDVVLRTPGEA